MRGNRSKSKGLSTTEKSKKVAYITDKVIEAFGDRLSTSKQNGRKVTHSDDEILAAFPNCLDETLNALLNVGYFSGKKGSFSEDTLQEEAKKLVLGIIQDTSNRDIKEVVREHVDELLTSLSNYSKTFNVYFPLHGLTLSKDVGLLKLGDASLLRMDEDFFHTLGKQSDFETPNAELKKAINALKVAENSERLENELDARQKEAKRLLERESDYETEIRRLKADISAAQRDLEEAQRVVIDMEMLREKIAVVRARMGLLREQTEIEPSGDVAKRGELENRRAMVADEELLREELSSLERALIEAQPNASRKQELIKVLAEMGERWAWMERKRSEAHELKQRIGLLKTQLEAVGKHKAESSYTLRKRIGQLRSDLASAEEGQTLINRFKDSSCLQYRYNVEWQKAKEFADRDATSVIDLLRYAIAAAKTGENVFFGRQGEVVRDIPTLFIIESGTNDFQEMSSLPNDHPPFEITPTHVTAMKDAGIFEMAASLTKEPNKLNTLERIIMRCIHWYSLSQIQPDGVVSY